MSARSWTEAEIVALVLRVVAEREAQIVEEIRQKIATATLDDAMKAALSLPASGAPA